jgi:hypothetical protein
VGIVVKQIAPAHGIERVHLGPDARRVRRAIGRPAPPDPTLRSKSGQCIKRGSRAAMAGQQVIIGNDPHSRRAQEAQTGKGFGGRKRRAGPFVRPDHQA